MSSNPDKKSITECNPWSKCAVLASVGLVTSAIAGLEHRAPHILNYIFRQVTEYSGLLHSETPIPTWSSADTRTSILAVGLGITLLSVAGLVAHLRQKDQQIAHPPAVPVPNYYKYTVKEFLQNGAKKDEQVPQVIYNHEIKHNALKKHFPPVSWGANQDIGSISLETDRIIVTSKTAKNNTDLDRFLPFDVWYIDHNMTIHKLPIPTYVDSLEKHLYMRELQRLQRGTSRGDTLPIIVKKDNDSSLYRITETILDVPIP